MEQLPVFKSSGNLANDIREIEESKAMGFGFWKSQLIEKGKARTGTTYVNGHPCMSSFNLDYVSDVEKDFLELLGMGQEQFDEINEIQANDRVRHIDFEWKPSFEGTQESLQLFYDLIKDYCPTVSTIEIYGETHYQTSGNSAIQYTKSPSTQNQQVGIKKWYQEQPTMKLYDSTMVEIHTGDTETNWYQGLLNLMVMDGNRILSYISTNTISERSYDKATFLAPDVWYAVLGKDAYSGLFADNINEGFGDILIKESEKTTDYENQETYFSPNFGGDFWSSAERELSAATEFGLYGINSFQGKIVNKYFEVKDRKYYLKYEAVRSAPPDELQYVMSNFINIKIVKDSKWYDGFVKFLGEIFSFVVKIGQGIFDFLMKIPVIGQWIEIHIRFFAKVFGKEYEDVKDLVRDNLGYIIIAIATYGIGTTVQLSIQALLISLEATALTVVEFLSVAGMELIAVGLYAIIESITYLLIMGTKAIATSIDSIISELYNLGLMLEGQSNDIVEAIEELTEKLEAVSVESNPIETNIFNPLDILAQQQEQLVDVDLPEIKY